MKNSESRQEILFANKNTLENYNAHTLKIISELHYGALASFKGIGIITAYGGLGNSIYDWAITSYERLRSSIQDAINNAEINGVILAINSPGGMASGLFETCDMIKNLSEVKPVYAYIDGEACSAAFALASACDRIYISAESITGCCGCYADVIEIDENRYKDFGLMHRIFRSKNAPKKNLSVITNEEAQKAYQAMIDEHGDHYLKMVALNRGVDPKEAETLFGQGAVVSAEYAMNAHMVDEIAGLNKCVSDLFDVCEGNGQDEPINNPEGSLPTEESEGEAMTLENFNKMSDEEQKTFVSSLQSSNPSLFAERDAETRKAERNRLTELNGLRNGSAAVDALVNAAVEDGRNAKDIALDVIEAMKGDKPSDSANEEARNNVLNVMADADEHANVPSASDEDVMDKIVNDINKERNGNE